MTSPVPGRIAVILRNVQCLPSVREGLRENSHSFKPEERENQPFEFEVHTDEEYEAFVELKKRLLSPPILALPRYGNTYTLDTDACKYQVGCVLLQEQLSGDCLPIEYWSRALTDAESNYTTTEKECLAVVWSILTLRPYLYGNTFDLRKIMRPSEGSSTWPIAPDG